MLQSVKNQQTLKILERLRKQGAPAAGQNDQSLEMAMGPNDEEGQAQPDPQPDEEQQGQEPEGQAGLVQTGMPDSPALQGLNMAKKKLKRRY